MPILRSVNTSQPSQSVGIDWNNPITQGLRSLDLPAYNWYTRIGAPAFRPTTKGVGFAGNGSSTALYKSIPGTVTTTAPQTILALVVGAAGGTDRRAYAIADAGSYFLAICSSRTNSEKMRLSMRSPVTDASVADTSATVFEAGVPHVAVIRYQDGVLASFVDGKADSSGSVTVSGTSAANLQIGIGALVRAGVGVTFNSSVVVVGACWNRALTDAEIASVSANPWQLFLPSRRIWVPASSTAGTHNATGALANAGGVIAGSATHFGNHPSSGALTNPGGVASGVAARTRVHSASGALVNPGGVVAGSAERSAGGTTHPSSGVLANPGAVVTGTATHFGNHPSTGALVNPGAVVAGSAARVPAAVTHNATGALQNPGAVLSGVAVNESGALIDTHDGFWLKQYRKMWEYGKKKPTIPELIEAIEEEPEIVRAIPEVAKAVRKEYGSVDVAKISANLEMQRFIARQIQLTIELRALEMERDDEELLLLFV